MIKTFKIIGINLLILSVLLLCCELYFRYTHSDYHYYEQTYSAKFNSTKAIHPIDTNWVQADPSLGWVCKQRAQLKFYFPQYHHINYQINAEGFRNARDFAELPAKTDKKRIVLLGDSFLFGLFLEENQTITHQLQQQLGPSYEVFNISVPAWGLDQMYLAYKAYKDVLDADQLIIMYIDDDISRLAEAFYWGVGCKPAFKLVDGSLEEKGAEDGKLAWLGRSTLFQSQLLNQLYQQHCKRQALPVAEWLFDDWIGEERRRGGELMIMRCPRIQQIAGALSSTPFKHDLFFSTREVDYFNLQEPLSQLSDSIQQSLFLSEDGHPSQKGASFIADFCLEKLRTKGR